MLSRAIALGGLATAVVVVALLLLGGDGASTYKLRFENAGQLVRGDDVQVGGRRIGTITGIRLTDDNQAEVTIEVGDGFAPLHEGTIARIRATSLSGVANRYVTLTPGPNNAPALPEGAVLGTDRTAPIVDIDQLFNTLDPDVRADLQRVIRGTATQYGGRGEQANAAARYFSPALSTTARLADELAYDSRALEDFLVQGSRTLTALAERRDTLSDLVGNAGRTASAIADERESLGRTLRLAPPTLRRARTTFGELRTTLDDLDVLVAESKPATRRLAPYLRELRPLVRDARPTVGDLRRLISRGGAGNDMIDLLRRSPRLAEVGGPALRDTTRALRRSTPVLDFIRPYTPDLVGWLRDFGQVSANYDANGHYARVQPMFNAFSYRDGPGGGTLTATPPRDRLKGFTYGSIRRCPGSASPVPPDGSAPFLDDALDCDPQALVAAP